MGFWKFPHWMDLSGSWSSVADVLKLQNSKEKRLKLYKKVQKKRIFIWSKV
jgi:hypothetical protein